MTLWSKWQAIKEHSSPSKLGLAHYEALCQYLLILQIVVLTMNSVIIWGAIQICSRRELDFFIVVFGLRVYISTISWMPPTFKSSGMTSWQRLQTILKYDSFRIDFRCLNSGS